MTAIHIIDMAALQQMFDDFDILVFGLFTRRDLLLDCIVLAQALQQERVYPTI
jgi:hypothetical protein